MECSLSQRQLGSLLYSCYVPTKKRDLFSNNVIVIFGTKQVGCSCLQKIYTMFDCFVGTFVFLFQTKYRKKPDSIKFTSVVDSPDLVHAKNSYMHCSEVSVFSSLIPGTR